MNDDSTEKRMAGDYEVIQAVQIGDREVVLGEKPQDETGMKYMCAFPGDCGRVRPAGCRASAENPHRTQ